VGGSLKSKFLFIWLTNLKSVEHKIFFSFCILNIHFDLSFVASWTPLPGAVTALPLPADQHNCIICFIHELCQVTSVELVSQNRM
jgi:hypothetical protein